MEKPQGQSDQTSSKKLSEVEAELEKMTAQVKTLEAKLTERSLDMAPMKQFSEVMANLDYKRNDLRDGESNEAGV
jgi:hypothetical protein